MKVMVSLIGVPIDIKCTITYGDTPITEDAECEVIETIINQPPLTASEVRDALNEKLKQERAREWEG